jgi:hypothetical protein
MVDVSDSYHLSIAHARDEGWRPNAEILPS